LLQDCDLPVESVGGGASFPAVDCEAHESVEARKRDVDLAAGDA
jgi:hypothetical protein